MSAEATVAVFDYAEGSDAEWRMLAILANAANPDGVVVGVRRTDLAARLGKTERGVAQIKKRLIDSGQLVVIEEGGGRGRPSVYWLKLPGLEGPEKGEDSGDSGNGASRKGRRRSNTGTSKTSTSPEERVREFCVELRDAEVSTGMQKDAGAMLREGKKVGSRMVTGAEMAIAAAALATFNRSFEWEGRTGSDFGLGRALPSIVSRIRERPSWDAAKHVRLVESAWRIRWWEKSRHKRRPTPNVIYGPGAFEQVAQDAKEEKEGASIDPSKRTYTRKRG